MFIALFMPIYSRLSNDLESWSNDKTGLVTAGRLARFAAQLTFNGVTMAAAYWGGAFLPGKIEQVGGVLGAATVTTLASQGAQYIAIFLFNRGYGDLNRNVLLGLSLNIVVTALATAAVPVAKELFLVVGISLGAIVFTLGVLSDLRSRFYPKRGIGVLFGTFNPFHTTHIELILCAFRERNLDKVVIHPTIVPRLLLRALERGELRVARIEDGMQVLEKTARADANVNYFPTGNRFFAPETRRNLIEIAIREAGLDGRVEVAFLPEIYADHGFHGVLREIRRSNRGAPIHGIHGSDRGGMMVRAILDECGWIYPMSVLRRDNVSATAIRAGAEGMTSASVTQILAQMKTDDELIVVENWRFRNDRGVLIASCLSWRSTRRCIFQR